MTLVLDREPERVPVQSGWVVQVVTSWDVLDDVVSRIDGLDDRTDVQIREGRVAFFWRLFPVVAA